jgi:hypothetical protein
LCCEIYGPFIQITTLPVEELHNIFNRFHCATATGSRDRKGFGQTFDIQILFCVWYFNFQAAKFIVNSNVQLIRHLTTEFEVGQPTAQFKIKNGRVKVCETYIG